LKEDSPGLHLKTYVLIFFIVLFAPLATFLLSKGYEKRVGSAEEKLGARRFFQFLPNIITYGYIWLWDSLLAHVICRLHDRSQPGRDYS